MNNIFNQMPGPKINSNQGRKSRLNPISKICGVCGPSGGHIVKLLTER
jgi:hypothetical protein